MASCSSMFIHVNIINIFSVYYLFNVMGDVGDNYITMWWELG